MTRAPTGTRGMSAKDAGKARIFAGTRPAWLEVMPSARASLVVLLTVVAIVFGGGGSPAPRPEIIVQLCMAAGCLAWIFLPNRQPGPIDRRLLAIAALVVVLPIVQLIPLPPALWQSLPGREVEVDALALVGADKAWMPWSISPARTLAALLAMLPAVAAMVMASRLDLSERRLVVATIAVLGLLSVAVGTLQLAAGPEDWVTFYPGSNGRVFGFQANRNAEVDVLLIALLAAVAVFAGWRRRGLAPLAVLAAFALVLVLGAALTGSRTGIALLPVAALFGAALLYRSGTAPRRLAVIAGGGLVLAGLAAFVLRDNAAIARVLVRFTGKEDFRLELWTDTIYAIGQYWPFGSGLGTIVPVLIGVERLEVVDETVPNRAHNDFLELALEGGVFGLIILAVIVALVGWMAWRAWRGKTAANRPLILFAVATLIIVALHSIVDYPLRSMALAHLAGVAAGLFAPPPRTENAPGKVRESQA